MCCASLTPERLHQGYGRDHYVGFFFVTWWPVTGPRPWEWAKLWPRLNPIILHLLLVNYPVTRSQVTQKTILMILTEHWGRRRPRAQKNEMKRKARERGKRRVKRKKKKNKERQTLTGFILQLWTNYYLQLFFMKKMFIVSNNKVGYFLHKAKPTNKENIKETFKKTTSFCFEKKKDIKVEFLSKQRWMKFLFCFALF